MGANGNGTLSEKTKLPLSLVIIIAGLLLAASASYWGVSSSLGQHVENCDVHHSTQALDSTYMRKDLSDQRYNALRDTLDEVRKDQKAAQAMLLSLGAKPPR